MEKLNKNLWNIAIISICGVVYAIGTDTRLFLPQNSEFISVFIFMGAPLIISLLISFGLIYKWFKQKFFTPRHALILVQAVCGLSALAALFDFGMRLVRRAPWMLRSSSLLVQDVILVVVCVLWVATSHSNAIFDEK